MAHNGKNNQDLKRYISAGVLRQVRERCGFGCVICGSMFYQYDHLGIEFKDADKHDPDKIVLLCGGCHDRKNRNFLSTETILRHAKVPRAKQDSFSWGELDLGIEFPEVLMGKIIARRSSSLLNVFGENIFSILPPEEEGLPFRVNACIYNKEGELVVKIVNNEFQPLASNWDVEVVGGKVSVRSALGVFDLVIRSEPPHRLVIERLNMIYKGVTIECSEGLDVVIKSEMGVIKTQGGEFDSCEIVIQVDENGMALGIGCEYMELAALSASVTSAPHRLK